MYPKYENYYDITPYNVHWAIFKCLDGDCVKKKSYECYNWCNNWPEAGASENCKMRCMDYADQMFDSLKTQNYTWINLLPEFSKYTLLNEQ